MLYFFYGADAWRMRQKVNELMAKYQAKHQSGLNFGRFDFSQEENFEPFKNFLEAYSMFAEKKLAVVENCFEASATVKESFLALIERGDILKTEEKFVVVVQEMKLNEDRKKKEKYVLKDELVKKLFAKLTGQKINQEEFNLLTGTKLESWITQAVQKLGGQIETSAVKKLAAYVGSDLWQLSNEVNKLVNFKVEQSIAEQDIDTLVRAKIESNIFKTIDALASRQKAVAFKMLHQDLTQGESVIALLGMLVYQFRNLLLVKSQIEQGVPFYNLERKLGLHPFVLRKTYEQSKNFSLPALKKIYERLAEIDLAIKSGQIEPQIALDLVVGEITG